MTTSSHDSGDDQAAADPVDDPAVGGEPTADDVVVVELTNPGVETLAISMTLGGATRRIATLAGGQSILLVSPPGATWAFELAAGAWEDDDLAPDADRSRGRSSPQ